MEINPRIKVVSIRHLVLLFACLYVTLLVSVSPAQSLPASEQKQSEDELRDQKERATWLETRNLEDEHNFDKMVFGALQELASEGLVDARILPYRAATVKRGRHQGFCFRKTKTGRFLPYICWKGSNEEK